MPAERANSLGSTYFAASLGELTSVTSLPRHSADRFVAKRAASSGGSSTWAHHDHPWRWQGAEVVPSSGAAEGITGVGGLEQADMRERAVLARHEAHRVVCGPVGAPAWRQDRKPLAVEAQRVFLPKAAHL